MTRINKIVSALAAGTMALSMSTAANADSHAMDMSGKTIEWTIPFSETI